MLRFWIYRQIYYYSTSNVIKNIMFYSCRFSRNYNFIFMCCVSNTSTRFVILNAWMTILEGGIASHQIMRYLEKKLPAIMCPVRPTLSFVFFRLDSKLSWIQRVLPCVVLIQGPDLLPGGRIRQVSGMYNMESDWGRIFRSRCTLQRYANRWVSLNVAQDINILPSTGPAMVWWWKSSTSLFFHMVGSTLFFLRRRCGPKGSVRPGWTEFGVHTSNYWDEGWMPTEKSRQAHHRTAHYSYIYLEDTRSTLA